MQALPVKGRVSDLRSEAARQQQIIRLRSDPQEMVSPVAARAAVARTFLHLIFMPGVASWPPLAPLRARICEH